MATIGNNAIEATEVALTDGDKFRAYRVSPAVDMKISKITCYTRTYTNANFKGVIVDNSASNPTIAIIGQKEELTNLNDFTYTGNTFT